MSESKDGLRGLSREQLQELIRKLADKPEAKESRTFPRFSGDPERAPVSSAQRRLWLVDRYQPGLPTYNVPLALKIDGPLSVPALDFALGRIVDRHQVLRSIFGTTPEGELVQRLGGAPRPRLETVDLSACAESGRLVGELEQAEAVRPFDLTRGPLLRFRLFRLGAERHRLAINLHHIVSDGWSLDILLSELSRLYAARLEGREDPLPELPAQYVDYAVWEAERRDSPGLLEALERCAGRLRGAPPALELPLDRPRQASAGEFGDFLQLPLPGKACLRLLDWTRERGATPFALFLALFGVALERWCGQRDMVVGTPLAGRSALEVEPLIGFFVNAVPLRLKWRDSPTFSAFLEGVREEAEEAFADGDVPFDRLVEELGAARDATLLPIFQVIFTYREVGESALALSGLETVPEPLNTGSAKFDLTVVVTRDGDRFDLAVEFDRDLFDRSTARRLARLMARVSDAIGQAPDRDLGGICPLSAAERHQLLVELAESPAEYPRDLGLAELFERQVERSPDRLAVTYDDCCLSFAGLERRASDLAGQLAAVGVRPGDRVGLATERTPDLVAAMVAVVRLGAAYVPLDPDYPAERLRFMARDSALSAIVGDGLETDEDLPRVRWTDRPSVPAPPPAHRGDGGDPVYVIYTSGSTGRPKGVMVTARSVSRLALGTDFVQLAPGERVAQAASASFDAITFEVWAPLLAGGTVVGLSREETLAPGDFATVLAKRSIDTIFLTTSLFNQIARHEATAYAPCRNVLFGGEAVDPGIVRTVLASGSPPRRLLNAYGPTETTTFAAWWCEEAMPPEGATVPIGHPLAHTRLDVVDRRLEPVPLGASGELVIGGPGLASGYLGRPALTASRFVPDGLSGGSGRRIYRSGDVVRRRWDGAIEFVGRLDHQVKIRGFRIEPGEVDAALLGLEAVRAATVVVRVDAPGERRLVAYVVPAHGAVDAALLKTELKHRLPDHMVPSAFVLLPELPLNANGKVDRGALPEPDDSALERAEYVHPRSPHEEVVAGLFADVLGVSRVGAEDDFFALGGHSLAAARLAARLEAALGASLTLGQIFEAPTVECVAAAAERAAGRVVYEDIEPVRREGALRLSSAQERLWFLDRLEPGTATYNIPLAVRLEGALDRRALASALVALRERHEVLRLTFGESGGRPVGRLESVPALPLAVVDLSEIPDGGTVAAHTARLEAARPFDLGSTPAMRWTLVRERSDRHRLWLTVHHILADGWSMDLLMNDLVALYAAEVGEGDTLPADRGIDYLDWAAWHENWLRSGAADEQLEWWRSTLGARRTVSELPYDRPPTEGLSNRGDRIHRPLGESDSSELHRFAASRGATPFMVLLTVLGVLLQRFGGGRAVVVGTPVAGRTRPETESLVGLFVNTLALPLELGAWKSFGSGVDAVRALTLAAFSRQDLPFDRVVEALLPNRGAGRNPLFDVMFTVTPGAGEPRSGGGLEWAPSEVDADTAKFDLGLSVQGGPGGMLVSWAFRTDLFDASTIERWGRSLETLIASGLAEPELELSALAHQTDAERHQILTEWSRDGWPAVAGSSIAELFAASVASGPDRTALVFEGAVWSYAALARRVAGLNEELTRRGIGAEDRVGLYLERSSEMVVALLAVLTRGAAYVPLEPEHPDERLAFQIRDAGLDLILCQAGGVARLETSAPDTPRLAQGWDALEADHGGSDPVEPQTPAYIIYTSGSTGQPKGVVVSHAAVANRLAFAAATDPAARGCGISKASISFDLSILEIFTPLVGGGRLVMCAPGGQRDLSYLVRRLAEERVTQVSLLPSQLLQLLEGGALAEAPALEAVMTGGEAVPPDLPERFYARHPKLTLWNRYGPTETTISTLSWPCEALRVPRTLPIGRPIAGARSVLVDGRGAPVSIGAAGELVVAGPGTARGYWGLPARTAQRFAPMPWGGKPGERGYRTGDLGRYRPDGAVEFLGRSDQQVKVRGHRIELGEIETVLNRSELARELAVVDLLEPVSGSRRLVAYAVPNETGPHGAELVSALRDAARAALPDYMVPSAVVELAELPLAPSGKVDRRRLPTPDWEAATKDLRPPSGALEERLAGIFGELLELERPSAEASFFDLGGHSLLATRLVARIEEEIGVAVPLRTLFERPTVAALAEHLASSGPRRTGAAGDKPRWLVELASGPPHGRPLVLVHGILGEVFSLHHLAEALSPARTVYGIESPMLAGGSAPGSIEEIAERYAEGLHRVFPKGDFHLGGLSMGGGIAAEVARSMADRDARPSLLVLLDSAEPGEAAEGREGLSLAGTLEDRAEVAALSAVAQAAGIELAPERLLDRAARAGVLRQLESSESAAAVFANSSLEEVLEVAGVHGRIALAHRPTRVDIEAVLFRAQVTLEQTGWPETTAWAEQFAGGCKVEIVPGDHGSFVQPPIFGALVERLVGWLAAVDEGSVRPRSAGGGEGVG